MDGNRWYLYHCSFCCTGLDSASAARLLKPFLLYFMMIVAAVGVIGSALMGHASLDIPAFTGFKDTLAPTGSSLDLCSRPCS